MGPPPLSQVVPESIPAREERAEAGPLPRDWDRQEYSRELAPVQAGYHSGLCHGVRAQDWDGESPESQGIQVETGGQHLHHGRSRHAPVEGLEHLKCLQSGLRSSRLTENLREVERPSIADLSSSWLGLRAWEPTSGSLSAHTL